MGYLTTPGNPTSESSRIPRRGRIDEKLCPAHWFPVVGMVTTRTKINIFSFCAFRVFPRRRTNSVLRLVFAGCRFRGCFQNGRSWYGKSRSHKPKPILPTNCVTASNKAFDFCFTTKQRVYYRSLPLKCFTKRQRSPRSLQMLLTQVILSHDCYLFFQIEPA